MDGQRILRITFLGLVFWGSFLLGYWLFGGQDFSFLSNENLFKIITAIVLSPIFGFILSTIVQEIWKLFRRIKTEYSLPQDDIFINAYFTSLERAANIRINRNTPRTNNFLNELYLRHQIIVREKMSSELISFCLRRMNIYWTHINIIGTFILGILAGLVFLIYLEWDKCGQIACEPDFKKYLTLIPLIIYLISAIFHARRARKEASDIENNWMIKTFF